MDQSGSNQSWPPQGTPPSPGVPSAPGAYTVPGPGMPGAPMLQGPISPEARKQALAANIASAVAAQNARVESQSDFQAVLITGQPVNHLLHFLIGVFTCGLWWIVWLVLVLTGGAKRHLVQVDEYGNVRVQHL
jgi:hypothetical protein